ncbi:MAG: ABC transporter permease [Lachnospiraceae bacterium]|nr:ABC transporter permease [Lachnospiraceae bacterium]
MFCHVFVYRIKELLRNPWHLAWNLLFPIGLATAFFFGFGNLIKEDPELFTAIPVGYVKEADQPFDEVMTSLSEDKKDPILKVSRYSGEEQAKKALRAGKVRGYYIQKGDTISVVVGRNGITSTTLHQILKEYENQKKVLETIGAKHPEKIAAAVETIQSRQNFLHPHVFNQYTSVYMNYFFSLIAMASLYGSWLSTTMLSGISANMTERGKRYESAPIRKMTSLSAGLAATMLLQGVFNGILVLYIQYVLQLHFGVPLWQVLVVTTVGGAMGIAIGIFIGALVKKKGLQMALTLGVSMVSSFLSGLMWGEIRQIIESRIPVVNRLNPAAMLTGCLYNLGNYGMTKNFYRDLYSMILMTLGLLLVSVAVLRRRNYDSL